MRQVLVRPVPHTLLSWRFLLPNQSAAVKMHRSVFLSAWSQLPRWQWAMIAAYSLLSWWLFWGWLHTFRSYQASSHKLKESQAISGIKQLAQLLSLTFAHGIPPGYYYRYALWREPGHCCLSYIYTHELPQWHRCFSPQISPASHQLMSHKKLFAEKMDVMGVSTVDTIALIMPDQVIDPAMLFRRQDLFIKPEVGSRGRDCMILLWQPEFQSYTLSTNEALQSQDEILQAVRNDTVSEDFLVQPLLRNHADLAQLCSTDRLITLRLITGMIERQARAIFAILEIPAKKEGYHYPMAVDITTGSLYYAAEPPADEHYQQLITQIQGKTLPFWQQSISICEQAHTATPDISTIGWDVVITPEGVKLLEGNINWAVAPHQVIPVTPALKSRLMQVLSNA